MRCWCGEAIGVCETSTDRLLGLNQLKGFNVTEFRILLQPDPDGANMVGRVFVPNPSVKTLEMVSSLLA